MRQAGRKIGKLGPVQTTGHPLMKAQSQKFISVRLHQCPKNQKIKNLSLCVL
jgi:hypothetical protein